MPLPTIIRLQDSSSQSWVVGVTNAGLLTSTTALGTSPTFLALNDSVLSQTWHLTILTSGMLQLVPVSSVSAPTQYVTTAPNGSLFAIQASSGLLQTLPASSCQFKLSDALADLSAELYDPTNQFWPTAELTLYIQEAMRTWNALTGYWRGDFLFNSQQGVIWYDLTDPVAAPNSLRKLTLTSTDLYTIIEYHLLEPPVGAGTWTGSAQFALSDIQHSIARRQNETLGVTGCVVSQGLVPANPGRTLLPSTVLDLRRVAFIPATGQGSPSVLWQDDSWAWQHFEVGYTTKPQGTPSTYALSTQPFLSFDVDQQPDVPGQYELLTVQTGVQSSSAAGGQSLSVPDDWSWVIKWGALADLLVRESNAKDVTRAQYAEGRYRQGLSLLAVAPALLGVRIGNVPLEIDSVKSADQYQTGWEAQAAATPNAVLVAGLNLVALSPVPDAGPYSITATVIENAPVPAVANDCLLLTTDVYETILGYAQHLAAFKMGGAEFLATEPMLQRFMQQAALYSSRLDEMGEFNRILREQSQLEDERNPRYSADLQPATED